MSPADWTIIALLIYILIMLTTSLYVFAKRKASVFDPIGQYIIFLSLFTLPLPIRSVITLEIEGNVSPYLVDFLPHMPMAIIYSAISISIFTIAYYSSWAKKFGRWLPVPVKRKKERSYLAFGLLTILSLLLLSALAVQSGGIINFLLLGYNSSSETFGKGYLSIGFPLIFIATLFLLYRYSIRRTKKDLLLFLFSWIIVIIMQLLMGNRGMIMYIILTTLIYVHFAINPLKVKTIALISIVAFLALNIFGHARTSNYESFSDFIEKTTSAIESSTAENNEGFFYTLTVGEFVIPFETLPQMIRTVGIEETPWFGISYLRSPLYLIPSAIFTDRPLPLANWYMQEYYGGGYGLNEGRQFFFLSEAYINFGPIGIVLISLLWGWMWGGLHQWLKINHYSPEIALIYALAVGFMFRCIAGDFSSLVAGFTQQSLAGVLLGLTITGVYWKSAKRSNYGN